MKDYLIRASAFDDHVRAFAVRSTELVKEVQTRLDTWATASAALGRALSAGAMMGAMLKDEERLTIQIKGTGPLGQIVVDANAHGDVRGYVNNPHVDLPLNQYGKLDVAGAVGEEGSLYVIKDLGLKEPYRGSSPIISGELAEDFTYYFAKSEQTPSSVGLGVLVSPDHTILAAGGFILQLLPGAPEEVIVRLEERLSTIKPISTLIQEGLSPEEILKEVFGEQPKILDRMEIRFNCGCSIERAQSSLLSLGKAEMLDIIEEGKEVEIECHFCREKYHISIDEVEDLVAKLSE